MKYIIYSILIGTTAMCFGREREYLFNGKNLDGWTIYVKNNAVKPESYFYVSEGVIETIGKPFGYLRTKGTYSNYVLHVEWRYPEEAVNSGVFLHTTGPDTIWPAHYQAQLKPQNAGDFIVHGVGQSATLGNVKYISTESQNKPVIAKLHPSNEKPAGEWNAYDITCKGNTIEIRVNGLIQNVAYDLSVAAGNIGLQAEGCRIQFRNLWIESLD
jgi:hypothetical protein